MGLSSVVDLAKALNVSHKTVYNWIAKGQVPAPYLDAIALRARCSRDWLTHGRTTEQQPGDKRFAHSTQLSDTGWPALVVRKSVAAVRAAEDLASVRLNGSQLADAVGIVVQMSALSDATSLQKIAEAVIGTMVATGQLGESSMVVSWDREAAQRSIASIVTKGPAHTSISRSKEAKRRR